ncbi:MAG: YhbY family RNA-binding protein [Opitutae bacterium]|nr:YhbY family RNA-binding protein [Opitutae bacterium]MDG1301346.1 YhbY family RNA-binding protein [Opitutae bacterium]
MLDVNLIMEDSIPLTSAEKKELRGIGQRLKPHLHIGKQGLSLTVSNEIETALAKNGLIKIRFEADRAQIKEYCEEIAKTRHCEHIGGVGKTSIFFREMAEEVSQ